MLSEALEEPTGEAWLRLGELLQKVVAVELSPRGRRSKAVAPRSLAAAEAPQAAPEPEKWSSAESPPLVPGGLSMALRAALHEI